MTSSAKYLKEELFLLTECQEIVESELKSLDLMKNKSPERLYEPIKYILSIGGKRIRPSLLLMATNLFSNDISKAVKPSLAIELFHNFTLLHDDIMDQSPLRRGKKTVHEVWNENIGILAGDAMSILAYDLLVQKDCPGLAEILNIFNQIALQVCEGQQYDMDFESATQVSLDAYLQMIELKTAVLIAGSLKIGALIGGASSDDADSLYHFGRHLGIAFQMQDDYLDVYGNPNEFQKFIGGDIVANKKTFLMLKAKEMANSEQLKVLNEVPVNSSISNEEKVKLVTAIFNHLDIETYIKKEISTYFNSALRFLENVQVPAERKSVLFQFADQLMQRKH